MSVRTCPTAEELLTWWLGEAGAAAEARVDEHLFSCAGCTAHLERLVRMGRAIRHETLRGTFGFVATPALLARMSGAGLNLREYCVGPGGSVNCTIAPEDDFVVSRMQAGLAGVPRLDVIIDDDTTGRRRLDDVPFDAGAGELALVPSAAWVRTMGATQQRVRLVAVEGGGERVIGDYTFNHSPG